MWSDKITKKKKEQDIPNQSKWCTPTLPYVCCIFLPHTQNCLAFSRNPFSIYTLDDASLYLRHYSNNLNGCIPRRSTPHECSLRRQQRGRDVRPGGGGCYLQRPERTGKWGGWGGSKRGRAGPEGAGTSMYTVRGGDSRQFGSYFSAGLGSSNSTIVLSATHTTSGQCWCQYVPLHSRSHQYSLVYNTCIVIYHEPQTYLTTEGYTPNVTRKNF